MCAGTPALTITQYFLFLPAGVTNNDRRVGKELKSLLKSGALRQLDTRRCIANSSCFEISPSTTLSNDLRRNSPFLAKKFASEGNTGSTLIWTAMTIL